MTPYMNTACNRSFL